MNPPADDPGTRRSSRSWKRRLIIWALEAGVVYVGVVIVLSALENWMVYHPIPASEDWIDPSVYGLEVQDVELHMADSTRLHAWWCPLENDSDNFANASAAGNEGHGSGALLYCHGNAGNLSHRAYAIPNWQQFLHVSVLIFDYPGYGKSAGRPSEKNCYAAADAAYDWLTQTKGVPADQVLIYGGSLGGGVAVDLASRRPHRALILAKTFTSMPEVGQSIYPWLPVRLVMRNRFDNLAKIGQCQHPVFIAHGTADGLVPISFAQKLYEAANEPKRFFFLEGCDHNDALSPKMFQELVTFLQSQEASTVAPSSASRNKQPMN